AHPSAGRAVALPFADADTGSLTHGPALEGVPAPARPAREGSSALAGDRRAGLPRLAGGPGAGDPDAGVRLPRRRRFPLARVPLAAAQRSRRERTARAPAVIGLLLALALAAQEAGGSGRGGWRHLRTPVAELLTDAEA